MRNQSGIRQTYYVGGRRYSVDPDADVPEEHLTEHLRAVLSAPSSARRPGPSLKRLVPAANAPGTFVAVGVPRTEAARLERLSASRTLAASPQRLPGWLSALGGSGGLWSAPDGSWPPEGEKAADRVGQWTRGLAVAMRRVLRGEPSAFAGREEGLSRREPPPAPLPGIPLVVLCACDAPRWEVRAIRGVLYDEDAPPLDLRVVEDASAPAASAAVREALGVPEDAPDGEWIDCPGGDLPAGSTVRYLRRPSRVGYLRNANDGAADFSPDRHSCAVWLNGDTDPGRGWLRALLRALASGPRVGFASPLSDNNVDWSVPLAEGCTPDEMADALLVAHDGTYPEMFLPSGFCLAVRAEVWSAFGPFDEATWGTGYGEETDLECKAWEKGWTAVAAPDAFVRHAKSRSFGGETASEASRRAISIIRTRYPWLDRTLREKLSAKPFQDLRARAGCLWRLPGDAPVDRGGVAFLTRSLTLSGGNLAMVLAADHLRRRGWDARLCALESRDLDLYDMDAAPIVFDGEPDLRRTFRADVFSRGLLVSGSYVTCDAGERVALDGGIVHVLFEQDDERRFAHNRGEGQRARIEAAWRDGHVVAVSSWVADAVEEVRRAAGGKLRADLPLRPPVCRAGFDPLVWYPRPRAEVPRIRVAAMYRPETAHRGGDVLLSVMRALDSAGAAVDFVLFGSRPPPGVRCDYVGKLPHHLLSRVVAGCDVLFDPSPFQGLGLDALQGLASGLALVCYENGGCREYALPGVNAVVLPPSASPASAVDALSALSRDRGALRLLQDAAPVSVSHLAWPALVGEWESALLPLLPAG